MNDVLGLLVGASAAVAGVTAVVAVVWPEAATRPPGWHPGRSRRTDPPAPPRGAHWVTIGGREARS